MDGSKPPFTCHGQTSQNAIEESADHFSKTEEGTEAMSDVEELPWHHEQLVELFGREFAEEVIHPKMEQKQRVDIKGFAGAAQLWSMLRNESSNKLLHEDKSIPADLKKSYGAFVRQLVLQRGKTPVERSFYETKDVPDMGHLLDKTRLLKIFDTQHKMELMGRSSKINQDRTSILMNNNPLPDLVNFAGYEGIDRYLPTGVDKDDESVASYRKWLDDKQRLVPTDEVTESLVELVRPVARDTSRQKGPPKVTFLTEVAATSGSGKFSEKYKEKREVESSVTNPADLNAGIVIDDVDLRPARGAQMNKPSDKRRSLTAAARQTAKSPWEPLTLNALVEYSDRKDGPGTGNFLNGKVKMYPLTHLHDRTA